MTDDLEVARKIAFGYVLAVLSDSEYKSNAEAADAIVGWFINYKGAPVASDSLLEAQRARDSLALIHLGTTDWPDLDLVIDAYRASEREIYEDDFQWWERQVELDREKYAALVEAATDALVYFDLKPHGAALKKARLRAALAALEAAGSA